MVNIAKQQTGRSMPPVAQFDMITKKLANSIHPKKDRNLSNLVLNNKYNPISPKIPIAPVTIIIATLSTIPTLNRSDVRMEITGVKNML